MLPLIAVIVLFASVFSLNPIGILIGLVLLSIAGLIENVKTSIEASKNRPRQSIVYNNPITYTHSEK